MAMPDLAPITDADLPEFCEFLHRNLDPEKPAASFRAAFDVQWGMAQPNHGFLLRANGELVGGIGAIYARRAIRGEPRDFCNITSWCVLEAFRAQSMRLLMALVAQPGLHFTNFSPTAVVEQSLKFVKFKPIDSSRTVLLNAPFASLAQRVVDDPDEMARVLPAEAVQVFEDHRHLPWLHQVAVGRPGAYCLFVFKRRTLKGLPSADIIAVSDRDLLMPCLRAFGRYVLLRNGMVSTRIESRLLPRTPALAKVLSGYRSKMFRSDTLEVADIDNLYSELVALDI